MDDILRIESDNEALSTKALLEQTSEAGDDIQVQL